MAETFELVSGNGDDNNDNFEISGSDLIINSDNLVTPPANDTINYCRVETTDDAGNTREDIMRVDVGTPVDNCNNFTQDSGFTANRILFDFGDGLSSFYQEITSEAGDSASVDLTAPYALSFNYELLPPQMSIFLMNGSQEIFQIFKSTTTGAGFLKFKGTETTPFDWPEQSYFRFELDNTGMGAVILNSDTIVTTSTGFSLGTTELLIQGDNVNQVTLDSMNVEAPIGTTAKDIVQPGTFAGTVRPTTKQGPYFIETRDDVSAIDKDSYELRDMVELFTAVDVTSDEHDVKLRTYSHGVISEGCENIITLTPGIAPNVVPTDIRLFELGITASDMAGTSVGYLLTTDPDGVPTYSFAPGTGDTDNSSFVIMGGTLMLNVQLTAGDYSIRVETDDGNGGTLEEALTVTVLP